MWVQAGAVSSTNSVKIQIYQNQHQVISLDISKYFLYVVHATFWDNYKRHVKLLTEYHNP